ncbi:MAG: hypothetical protein VW238_03365, partial [Nitrosomonadales bacterium]
MKKIALVEFDRFINNKFITSPPVYNEFFFALLKTLKNLGHDVVIQKNKILDSHINIIFGFHRILETIENIQFEKNKKIIFFNSEPINLDLNLIDADIISSNKWINYLSLINNYPVIDYSDFNLSIVDSLDKLKFKFGYFDFMFPNFDKVNEGLFFGNFSPRRKEIINLISEKVKVNIIDNEWGTYRDYFISSSDFVININRFDRRYGIPPLEVFRIWHTLCHGTEVISEVSGD